MTDKPQKMSKVWFAWERDAMGLVTPVKIHGDHKDASIPTTKEGNRSFVESHLLPENEVGLTLLELADKYPKPKV